MELWHNSRCSKSRQGKELVVKYGVKIVDYMKHPPSRDDVWKVCEQLDMQPLDLIRKNEKLYKELVKEKGEPTQAKAVKWMAKHPRLIQRPILVKGDKAVLGRPPEKLLDLL